MNENETVNESQSQTAGGSGDSPEKRVADFVEDLCRHIADNGYDLLADVAVESLVANGAVPSGAYLHSVKTAWCLHRAAVHYARQYGAERAAADRARADAQFEHSHRAQAERKAEKLEAELAQSVLLVENQRLRMEEMRQEMEGREQQAREVRQQMLETAESALLEQQQRNEQLVTEGSQQRMKIAELEQLLANKKRRISELETMVIDLRNINTTAEKSVEAAGRQNSDLQAQVKFLKDREATLGTRLEEEKAVTTKRLDQIQELRSEVSHVQRLWGESRRRVEELEQQMQDKQEPAIPAGGGLLRDVSHYTEMAETDTPDADVSAEQQQVQMRAGRWRTRGGEVRNVTPTPAEDERAVRYSWYDAQYDQTWLPSGHYHTGHTESPLDLLDYLGTIEAEPEPQPVHQQAIIEAQAETIARLHSEVSALNTKVSELERMQKDDRIAGSGTLDAVTAEPQAEAEYSAPEGWRLLQVGEVIEAGDEHVSKVDDARSQRVPIGTVVPQYVRYIRRIEQQPVQVREGRWRTRGGEIRNVTPTPAENSRGGRYSWHDVHYNETWLPSGRYCIRGESLLDLLEYLGPIEPETGSEQIAS